MPSGRTHDRITLWTLPAITALSFAVTRSPTHTLLVAGGFLFSGLMFGPDLDLHSRPFTRWGLFRWIWIPYQQTLRHRSVFSHGPIIGTVLRVIYLAGWLAVFALFVWVAGQFAGSPWNWRETSQTLLETLQQYWPECLALFIGLELGAMSHSLSDVTGSAYKRFQRQGVQGLLSPKRKKRRPVRKKKSQKHNK
ncbi:metal-binding protein [Ancylothrix sp. C2]|uniref:metal-binding protein n=1 Tax=Ancylothrix sp. D3o TaxID=2953691 RepID=UPI0021BA5F46|nr:metal-binding protein [Ancylothrix sp. D3o]MCT7952439.1 metal-binding protein [Ancylothrix sp. D3o]